MVGSSGSLDYYRKLFRGANADIFEVIDHAILVAASDFPEEFRNRRDQIAEKLYTAVLPRCFGCDQVAEEGDGSVKREVGKESKMDNCNEAFEDLRHVVSIYSYDEAEALTDEMEEESQVVGEVLRIKEIFLNKQDQSDSGLFESLRRLQLMQLSMETLKATEIGKAVNGLRKHNSKQIRHLVRTLIEGWKVLVDEWVNATSAIADNSPTSLNPSVVDEEEGLPFPPLDEGALLATQTTTIELAEFFDGLDDDGNFRSTGVSDKQRDNGRRPPVNHEPVRNPQPSRPLVNPEVKSQIRRQEPVPRQTKPQEASPNLAKPESITNNLRKPTNAVSGPGRPLKPASEQKACEVKPKQPQDFSTVQRKPLTSPDISENSMDASDRARLEIAKRKLHEGYQQAETAKKQRTIQVMELHDIPKVGQQKRQANLKHKNGIRSWAMGRR